MIGPWVRRGLWTLAVLAGLGAALYYAALQLDAAAPGHLNRTAGALLQWRGVLDRYGPWVHLIAHGATYLYLILRWPNFLAWIDRRRIARGHGPMSDDEKRRLAVSVLVVCLAYESLLFLRYLG